MSPDAHGRTIALGPRAFSVRVLRRWAYSAPNTSSTSGSSHTRPSIIAGHKVDLVRIRFLHDFVPVRWCLARHSVFAELNVYFSRLAHHVSIAPAFCALSAGSSSDSGKIQGHYNGYSEGAVLDVESGVLEGAS